MSAASQPSRHLLLGNISSRPNESALETVFGKFGPLESVKVFPGKTYALVSFQDLAPAAEAMQCLDGHSLLSVSGVTPLANFPIISMIWWLPESVVFYIMTLLYCWGLCSWLPLYACHTCWHCMVCPVDFVACCSG